MDIIRRYDVPFRGLASGKYNFTYCIDSEFFEAFGNTDMSSDDIVAVLDLTKSPDMLFLKFHITGSVRMQCDRCLEECTLPVDVGNSLYVKFGEGGKDGGDEDVVWLNRTESEFNVAQHIYESIILGLPLRKAHPEDENGMSECNPDMLGRFTILSDAQGEEVSNVSTQKTEGDPQWEKLRRIK